MKLQINSQANKIINKLQQSGYEAYIVGGCVRDMILGRTPKDWDICTNATPEETMEVFKEFQIIPTGLPHGTITILIDGEGFEVTTYRIDGEYSDGRHPDDVQFTTSIKEDLARRDFTINAMAYNHIDGLIDPFYGFNYLEDETISCVGDPNKRFQEDGLRIMRAVRFVSQLGFQIDLETANAIYTNKQLLQKVSKERTRDEIIKIIMSSNPSKGLSLLYGLEVMEILIPEIAKQTIKEDTKDLGLIDKLPNDLETRLAGLLSKLNKPKRTTINLDILNEVVGGLDIKTQPKGFCGVLSKIKGTLNVEEQTELSLILQRLRFSNQEIHEISQLIDFSNIELQSTKPFILGMLNKIGENQLRKLIELQKVIKPADLYEFEKLLNSLDLEKECYEIKHLEITGNDLIEIGIKPGKILGEILQELLNKVIAGELENKKEELLGETKVN